LIQSVSKAGLNGNLDLETLVKSIQKLIDANKNENGNILICLIQRKQKTHILLWYVQHHYPSAEDYQHGVDVITLKAVRKKPQAKIWNTSLRKQADYIIGKSEVYEALLVDGRKNVTEGSRSNIFFIRGNSIFTPPLNKVLPGITREKVMLLCDQMIIKLSEKDIPLSELAFYEAAFLSGTSPGILPIKMIDNIRFNTSNEIMQKLMHAYNVLTKSENK
jgi:branched-chain amino acid aminotransferase